MASYNELNALIDAYINQNGVQAITGQILNGVLKAIVEQIGRGYALMGVADPSTDPGTPDAPESWFASEPGTYMDFGELTIAPGEFALLYFIPSEGWFKNTIYEGFQSVGATIDANVGTPSVGVSYANGVLSFDFHNMKGNTGDPAGFGTIGATVDGNIGTPGVTVSESGPDTAKNLTFAFTNLKGETGVTSVVATVDNTSGNPSCAVSLNAGVLTLAFSGLKGAQGNTGSSVDYPYELVNNLTTNDATKGLAASQGVALAGQVSQLEQKVDGYEFSDNFNITSTGAHSSTSDRLSFNPVIPKGTYILLIESGTSGNAGVIGLYPHYVGDGGNTNIGTIYINVPTQVTLTKDMDSLGLYMSATVNTGTGTMPLTIRSVNSVEQTLDNLSDYVEIKKEVTGTYSLQFPIDGNTRLNQAVPLDFTGKCRVTMRVISGTDTWKWQLFRNINGTKGVALTEEINLGSSVDIEIPSTDSGVWAYSVAGSVTVGRVYELAFTQIEQTLNGKVGEVESLAEENQADINKQETQSTLTSVHTVSSRYMSVSNGGEFTSSSSGAAINFYKITKGRKYIISAPKGVNSACYGLAYANVIGDNLPGTQVYEFADTVGTSAEPFNYTILSAQDYGYLCVGYIAANGQPTVTEVSVSYRFALAGADDAKIKIRMLCFGNSFTQDSVNYAPFILKGIYPECDLIICMAIIGGSPLAQHCANITGVAQSDGTDTYQPGVKYNNYVYHNGSSVWEEGGQKTAAELLQMEEWDIVTFQQGGQVNYGNYNTYYKPFLNSTFKALNGILTNPYKIGWLLTHGAYDTTAATVLSHWEGSKDNTEQLLNDTPVSVLFPYGTAIQNLRTTPIAVGAYGAGVLQADIAHLQEGIPTLCASYSIVLTLLDVMGVNWKGVMGEQTRPDYAWITGHNCPGTNYATPGVVEGITEENCYLAQFAATAAKEHPFVVTQID